VLEVKETALNFCVSFDDHASVLQRRRNGRQESDKEAVAAAPIDRGAGGDSDPNDASLQTESSSSQQHFAVQRVCPVRQQNSQQLCHQTEEHPAAQGARRIPRLKLLQ